MKARHAEYSALDMAAFIIDSPHTDTIFCEHLSSHYGQYETPTEVQS